MADKATSYPDLGGISNPMYNPDFPTAPTEDGLLHIDSPTSASNSDVSEVKTSTSDVSVESPATSVFGEVSNSIKGDSQSPPVPPPSGDHPSPAVAIGFQTKQPSKSRKTPEKDACCCGCSNRCCHTTAIVFAASFVVVGAAMLLGLYSVIFDAVLKSQLQIKEGSIAYDIWKDTPVPLTLSFYLYNLTNPEEFTNGDKAILEELGPYVYQEFHLKVGLEFHQDNSTVSFYQRRWWTWDEAASGNLTEQDPLCFLNTVPVSAAYSVRDSDIALTGLNIVLNRLDEQITLTRTVKEVLFDGYEDPLLNVTQSAFGGDDPQFPGLSEVLDLPPGLLNYDKMGWFYKRNNSDSYDGHFNMFTGQDTVDTLGVLDWWNKTRNPEFFPEPCGVIHGSAGELWPPYQEKTKITFYSSDLCMSLTLKYKHDVTDDFDLLGNRYWADNTTFANYEVEPANQCYCFQNNTDNCPPSGLLDAETCRMGSPAFISFPHFLHGDPQLLKDVIGVSDPIEERHMFHLDMIPELGVPMKVRARMQINMAVRPYKGFLGFGGVDIMKKLRPVTLPLLWFEVEAGLTEDLASQLRPVLYMMRSSLMTVIWSVFVGVGCIALIGIGSRSYYKKKHDYRV